MPLLRVCGWPLLIVLVWPAQLVLVDPYWQTVCWISIVGSVWKTSLWMAIKQSESWILLFLCNFLLIPLLCTEFIRPWAVNAIEKQNTTFFTSVFLSWKMCCSVPSSSQVLITVFYSLLSSAIFWKCFSNWCLVIHDEYCTNFAQCQFFFAHEVHAMSRESGLGTVQSCPFTYVAHNRRLLMSIVCSTDSYICIHTYSC